MATKPIEPLAMRSDRRNVLKGGVWGLLASAGPRAAAAADGPARPACRDNRGTAELEALLAARRSVVSILVDPAPERRQAAPEPLDPERLVAKASGFVMHRGGFVTTNCHVVAGGTVRAVRTADGRMRPVLGLAGSDRLTDLAVLRVEAIDDVPVLPVDDRIATIGSDVFALGDPYGYRASLTRGIVSALDQPYTDIDPVGYLQHDAAINAGSSGGPLLNRCGELIGINTAIADQSPSFAGIGFAVPTALAVPVLGALTDRGRIERGSLGVRVQQLTAGLAAGLGLSRVSGLLVAEVAPGSAGEAMGLRAGDLVVMAGAGEMRLPRDLGRLLLNSRPGDGLEIGVLRSGRELVLAAALGVESQPVPGPAGAAEPTAEGPSLPFGAEFSPVSREPGRPGGGVLLEAIAPDGAASRAGIAPGDIIHSISGEPVLHADQFLARWQAGGSTPITLLVSRQSQAPQYILVTRTAGETALSLRRGNQMTSASARF